MGKKKTNQAQQTQRLQDVDDNFTDNNQTNRPSQKLTEEKVNRVHDIFPDWPKADIRRALEDSDYDEERVVQSHLQGGDSWQEVSKTKVKETVSRPKSRRTASGTQNTGERVERGTRSERGRGGGRGGKSMGLTRSDRKTDTDVTAASVKEFVAPVKETTDDNVQQGTRSFRSYSEAAAVSNEPIVSEPVVVQTKPERKERPKRERQPPVKKQQPVLQEIVSPTSPPTSQQQQQQHNRDVISPPQPSPKKSLSPQDKKQDAVVLPVGFNAVDVQFGSLGINDTEQAQANVVENPSAPLEQKESQTEFYGQAWGGTEQYQNEPVTQSYEEGANAQYQQQYQQQQQQLYGFQQSQQTQTQPRTDKGSQAQRTSPNLQYGKQPSYAPTHPYTGIHGGAQNPYQYPTYPSYPHPYMMPNQFQYHNYPMPGNKYGQFYGQNKPYNAYAPTQGNATAPTEESNLDYNKQFEMSNPNYFYMQHHPQQHQGAQTETGKTKKDSRSPNEQGVDAQQQQQHQAFGHYPYAMHYGYMGFQPQNMGFPQQQYQPQPTTQQGAQSHGKGSSNQQQQSSLTGSTWQ